MKKRNGQLSAPGFNKIPPKHRSPPRIYRPPNIHKSNILLRPIVSFVNTFARDLSAHLIDILAPLKEKSDYKVKNLAHFVYSIITEGLMKRYHCIIRCKIIIYKG